MMTDELGIHPEYVLAIYLRSPDQIMHITERINHKCAVLIGEHGDLSPALLSRLWAIVRDVILNHVSPIEQIWFLPIWQTGVTLAVEGAAKAAGHLNAP
jgi:hypothetical protein